MRYPRRVTFYYKLFFIIISIVVLLCSYFYYRFRAVISEAFVPYQMEEYAKRYDSFYRSDIRYLEEVDMLGQMIRSFKQAKTLRVMDAGCGTGTHLSMIAPKFPHVSFVGFDKSTEMVAEARAKCAGLKNVTFVTGSFLKMPFDVLGKFDIITSFYEPIFYEERWMDCIMNLSKCLKPEGLFAIQFIAREKMTMENPHLQTGLESTRWIHQGGDKYQYEEHTSDKMYVHTLYLPDRVTFEGVLTKYFHIMRREPVINDPAETTYICKLRLAE